MVVLLIVFSIEIVEYLELQSNNDSKRIQKLLVSGEEKLGKLNRTGDIINW
jgi:hypothetical protein